MSGSTVLRIDRGANPFEAMSEEERMRLIVRVLCELVAYGEPDDAGQLTPRPIERAAS